MRILAIAGKDLLQVWRDRQSALFLVLMPLAFTVFFGLTFRGEPAQPADARQPVGWVNLDPGGQLARGVRVLLEDSGTISLVDLTADQVDQAVRDGEVVAAVTVPSGFTASALAGSTSPVIVTTSGGQGGTAVQLAVETAVDKALGAVETANLGLEQAGTAIDRQEYASQAIELALDAWQAPTVVAVPVKSYSAPLDPAGFLQSSPGMMVQFAFFSLLNTAMLLVVERKNRALRRMRTTTVPAWQVIAGHAIAMLSVVLLQQLLLVGVGQLLGVNYLREPGAMLLMMVALGMCVTGIGLLVGALARREEHVVAICLMLSLGLAALGGAWFPLEATGQGFAAIGRLLPSGWAVMGFQNIAARGLGMSSVLAPAAAMAGYGLVFLVAGSALLRRQD